MINAYWLFAIVPGATLFGFILAAVCQMAHDPNPELDESHSATRYAQVDHDIRR